MLDNCCGCFSVAKFHLCSGNMWFGQI